MDKYHGFLSSVRVTKMQGAILINFNPSMNEGLHSLYIGGNEYLSITKFQRFGCTAEAWKFISELRDFIPHITGQVNTYPCWYQSYTELRGLVSWIQFHHRNVFWG